MMIRNVVADDYDEVFDLLKQLWPGLNLDKQIQKSSFNNTISSDNEFGLCALKDNKVIGYCSVATMNNYLYNGYIFYITTLIVDKNHRRQGTGKSMIDKVKELAIEKKIKAIELDSGFHREEAHIFYENLGFGKECYFFSMEI